MKTTNVVKILSGALVATVIAVGTASAANPIQTELSKPDMMATPLGMSIAGGKKAWGTSFVVSNPGLVTAIGVGLGQNLCRFSPVGLRPFNKGLAPTGNFKMQVYRNNMPVHSAFFTLGPQSGLPGSGWHNFTLDLPQGSSLIKVVMDPNGAVAESDESNNVYTLKVRVNVPCSRPGLGAPSVQKKPGASKSFIPGKATPKPRPTYRLKRQ